MTERRLIVEIVSRGHTELPAPVRLASGDWSSHFVDVKRALADGESAAAVARAIIDEADDHGIAFDAVGGMTMGADVLAHGVALLRPRTQWFTVRKQAKDRGTRRRVEGAVLGPGMRTLLVDDVVTRGGSILDALAVVRGTGAEIVGATAVVDRGDHGVESFAREGIPYFPLLSYRDLGIPAVGSEPEAPAPVPAT